MTQSNSLQFGWLPVAFLFLIFSSYFYPVLHHNSIDFVGSVTLIWQNIMHNSEMKILEVNII